ncbi:MAG TPA: phospholipid carrier-dependent glycosyltransferase [Alphaproteobacteria bacterium]|nr:phospholipid carrier-dependent glycosyltransferase [Alphaproteobacteria bacterium]
MAQVAGETPNFNHPRLLLDATAAVLTFRPNPSSQDIVVAGRFVSALAAVLAVDLLALLALLLYGELAGLFVALVVGLDPLLYGLAHYMKEDAVYVFGLGLFLVALARYGRNPDWSRLSQLGLAAGVTASGKYPGVATVAIAVALVIWQSRVLQHDPPGLTAKKAGVAVALAAAVFLAVDWQLFTALKSFAGGLRLGASQAATGGALSRPILSKLYIEGLIDLCPFMAIGAFGCYVVATLRSKKPLGAVELAIALLPIAYLLVLQLSPSKRIRYELPPLVMILAAAAMFIGRVAQRHRRIELRIAAWLAMAAIVGSECASVTASRAAILNDSRAQMARWIRTNLPQSAVLAASEVDGLSESQSPTPGPADVPTRLMVAGDPFDLGDLDALRAKGVTHVLVTESVIGRYFNRSLQRDETDVRDVYKAAHFPDFYRELFATGKLVHHIPSARPLGTLFSPELWLFEIRRGADMPEHPLEPPTFLSPQE